MIRKTLETTGQEKLFYIGHSMGTTGFMVMSVMHPEMNEKIELASLMAPVAYLGHARSPLKYLAPFADQIDVRKFQYLQNISFYYILKHIIHKQTAVSCFFLSSGF